MRDTHLTGLAASTNATPVLQSVRRLRDRIASPGQNMITVLSEATHLYVKFSCEQFATWRMQQLTKPADVGEGALQVLNIIAIPSDAPRRRRTSEGFQGRPTNGGDYIVQPDGSGERNVQFDRAR
jgi:hypothetical protein